MRASHLLVPLLMAAFVAGCTHAPEVPEEVTPRVPTATVPAPTPIPTPSPVMKTSSENVYVDPVGSLRFLLDVENSSGYLVERVRASVILRDGGGSTVASQSAYAGLDLLKPGESASVMVVFFLDSPDFVTHDIRIDAHKADYVPQLLHPGLEILDYSGRVGEWVPYEVLGQVHNTSGVDARSVTLAVTCYDDQGKIVAIGTGRPEDRTIPAGESSAFLVSLGAVAGNVDTCRVQAEGLLPAGDH
jgi:hypothetical protein